ncbi:MAG: translesion DNA synthesis-associated protein ImuA [Gammaproteobacteria bacterium]|nr:translesion DNA synthesis-associated protein ImuA [Gammaproteobacteria bacterium]
MWRGKTYNGQAYNGRARSMSSGFDELDEALPTGGWPPGAVVEIMIPAIDIGELRLWLPVIKRMTQEQRYVMIANPPYLPYAPILANAGIDLDYIRWLSLDDEQDTLCALEKALRNRECAMALWWPDIPSIRQGGGLNDSAVRRLQAAAREGESLLGLYRITTDDRAIRQSTWAALRLQLRIRQEGGLDIDVLKARGSRHCRSVALGKNMTYRQDSS